MKKRILALALSLVVVVSVSGCGDNSEPESNQPEKPTVSEEKVVIPEYELVETTTTKMMNGETYVNYFVVVSPDVSIDGKRAIFQEMRNYKEGYSHHTVYFYNDKEIVQADIENEKSYIDLIDDITGYAPSYHYYKNEESNEGENQETQQKEQTPTITMGQRNALQSALNYLNVMAFSKSGLIDQLEYEGYSTEEATYAVENCGADWNEQAAKSAQNYINTMSFSRSGLIDQLIYEGFTQEQAEYGVSAVGY